MRTETGSPSTGANIGLTGLLLIANLDTTSLLDYALKAAIGGAIWMVFKMGSDVFTYYLEKRKNETSKLRNDET